MHYKYLLNDGHLYFHIVLFLDKEFMVFFFLLLLSWLYQSFPLTVCVFVMGNVDRKIYPLIFSSKFGLEVLNPFKTDLRVVWVAQ